MDLLAFEHHLESPVGIGLLADCPNRGSAGGALCGDLIDFRVKITDSGSVACGFDAEGCGALTAAGSAISTLAGNQLPLDAARVSISEVCEELGGVSAAKIHAVELAVDAFHRALGEAIRTVSLEPVAGRRLVAMSGGVDSAVAAQLSGPESSVGVTLELWRDGDTDALLSGARGTWPMKWGFPISPLTSERTSGPVSLTHGLRATATAQLQTLVFSATGGFGSRQWLTSPRG